MQDKCAVITLRMLVIHFIRNLTHVPANYSSASVKYLSIFALNDDGSVKWECTLTVLVNNGFCMVISLYIETNYWQLWNLLSFCWIF